MGVPVDEIPDIAQNSCNTIPCYMPYITSYFMPRAMGDRPLVVPEGSANLAFIGNFSETAKDTVFTTEYSVRTAMEAVYQLLTIDRGVPEVFASAFDVRTLLASTARLLDGKKLTDIDAPFILKQIGKLGIHKTKDTIIYDLLKESKLI